jgi:hypothetical protein
METEYFVFALQEPIHSELISADKKPVVTKSSSKQVDGNSIE